MIKMDEWYEFFLAAVPLPVLFVILAGLVVYSLVAG
jgi:hypothetical protein